MNAAPLAATALPGGCGTDLLRAPAPRPQPARRDGRSEAQRSVDALTGAARRYRTSAEYASLLQFIRSFRGYAPFNGLLVHVQKPGSAFVASPHRWRTEYGRVLRTGAQPLAILQPFGPVMFVFDVADTEPLPGAPALPPEITDPFNVVGKVPQAAVRQAIELTLANAVRDGVRTTDIPAGSQLAGQIGWTHTSCTQSFQVRRRPQPASLEVPVRFALELNAAHQGLTRYATVCHELAHLYCGHLGTHNATWWPDRHSVVDHRTAEFEAESVSAIAVWRLDPSADMPPYLAQHLSTERDVPPHMSLERVTQVAGLVCRMAKEPLGLRAGA